MVLVFPCKFNQENQYFRYDIDSQQIFCGPKRDNNCIDIDMKTKLLIVTNCSSEKVTQKWVWGFHNETMLRNWANFGKAIIDEDELKEFTL